MWKIAKWKTLRKIVVVKAKEKMNGENKNRVNFCP